MSDNRHYVAATQPEIEDDGSTESHRHMVSHFEPPVRGLIDWKILATNVDPSRGAIGKAIIYFLLRNAATDLDRFSMR